MSYGFVEGAVPKGCEVEAIGNSIMIGDTILVTLNATGKPVDWKHPDTNVAFSHNLQNTMLKSGLLENCGEIWKR